MMINKTIILGIGGGIAAYKCCDLTRHLIEAGAKVHVILTASAQHFVTPLTLQTLSRHPVHTDLFDPNEEATINHIALADLTSLILIAPATADILARINAGICNDLLTTVVSATKAPILFAPSMNCHMWENPITQRNVRSLRELGYHFIDPREGSLACGYEGMGRLPEVQEIVSAIEKILESPSRT